MFLINSQSGCFGEGFKWNEWVYFSYFTRKDIFKNISSGKFTEMVILGTKLQQPEKLTPVKNI